MNKEEAEEIAAIVEAQMQKHEHEKDEPEMPLIRRSWKHRTAILIVVLVLGVAIHYLIENTEWKYAFHSAELALAAIIDSVFAKAREL